MEIDAGDQFDDISIHTLNARDSIYYDIMREYYGLSFDVISQAISHQLSGITEELAQNGIRYADLKNVLTPQKDRLEICLIFDTTKISESLYGDAILSKIIPVLKTCSDHCVLCGDFTGSNVSQEKLWELFESYTVPTNDTIFQNSIQYYLVYINNLTERMFLAIVEALHPHDEFVGFADCTYSSRFKSYISAILPQRFILFKRVIILRGTEDDPTCNENPDSFPYQDHGLRVAVMSHTRYVSLLNYKIERQVVPGFEFDNTVSLSAISPKVAHQPEVYIEPSKFNYLLEKKIDSLSRIHIESIGIKGLKDLIQSKISSNYYFNLKFNAQHNVAKFNILIEHQDDSKKFRAKFLVSMELKAKDNIFRLITMF